jgi:hypothetical protein
MKRRDEPQRHAPRLDETVGDALEALFGRVLDGCGHSRDYDEHFARWLEGAHAPRSREERDVVSRVARAAAARLPMRVRALQAGARMLTAKLHERPASVVGSIAAVADSAAAVRCAPWLDTLAVAAGYGRELWDEPCDRWVELPRDLERGRYLALGVAGDSMEPYLRDGDVIVVDPHASLAEHTVVVARRPDDGYVVKYVSRLTRRAMELSSFNAEYAPFAVARRPGVFVGAVVARLTRGRDAD